MGDPHEAYFSALDPGIAERLLAVRDVLEGAVPDASRCMSYQMPALRAERIVVWFAAFKRHIGIYPPVQGPPDLVAALDPFAGPKRNLIFPHAQPLPLELIARVGTALAAQAARPAG